MIRPFQPGDEAPVAALMRQALGVDITADRLMQEHVRVPGFRPDHLLLTAAQDGFVLAPRRVTAGPPGAGWIAAIAAPPGEGTALLQAAIRGMRRDGVTQVDVADVPVRYVLPGVDRAAFPHAHALFARCGFTDVDEVASMGIALAAASRAPAIRPCAGYAALPAFLEPFGPGWWPFFAQSIRATRAGDPTPSDVLGWFEADRLCGVVHYRGGRFGPLAVDGAWRRHGIGAALTRAALGAMHGHGLRHAHFMIATAAVQPFYRRLGFVTLRHFTRMRLAV